MKLIKYLVLLLLFITFECNAFDLRTHMFVGNEVVNDLVDDKVNIPPFGDFSVDPNLSAAIKNNKGLYLLGTLGPDAMPDFIGGQITTHAGEHIGWSTDEWLKYLATPPSGMSADRWNALYRGYLSHAASDIFAHTYVNIYAGDAFDLLDEDNLLVEARHKKIEGFIAEHQPYKVDANYWLSSAKISDSSIEGIKRKFISSQSPSNQYAKFSATTHLKAMYDFEKEIDGLATPIGILKSSILELINNYEDRKEFYETLIERYDSQSATNDQELTNERKALKRFKDSLGDLPKITDCKVVWSTEEQQNFNHSIGTCVWASEIPGYIIEKNNLLGSISDAEDTITDLEEFASNFYQNNPDLAQWAENLGLEEIARSDAAELIVLISAVIVFGDELDWQTIAFQAAFNLYRKKVVHDAGKAYVRANVELGRLIASGASYSEQVDPIKNWLTCYGPVYLHESAVLAPVACDAAEVTGNLFDIINAAAMAAIQDTAMMDLYNDFQTLKGKIKTAALNFGEKVVLGALSSEQQQMVQFLLEANTEEVMAEVFSQSGSTKLLKIPDITDRLRKDMYVNSQGHFDKTKFSPVYNAIQLSKLALLDDDQIRNLEMKARGDHINTLPAYHNGQYNLMYSWIRSLDGNHQWMPTSPLLPRETGVMDPTTDDERTYSVNGGLAIWSESDARKKVFQSVFKGPLVPSLEAPDIVGTTDILPSNYYQRNCFSEPFPITDDAQKCVPVSAWLIPILHLLQ